MGEGLWLVAFLILQRLAELLLARRNTVRLRAEGAVEYGAGHYPIMVAVHVSWLLALAWFGHDRAIAPGWFALFVVLQAGRAWVITSLGRRWTTRVLVLPGAAPVAGGPYRWLRHPNYLIVAMEITVVPLALGLPCVALLFFLANAMVLVWRSRVESRALAWAAGALPGAGAIPAAAFQGVAKGWPRR